MTQDPGEAERDGMNPPRRSPLSPAALSLADAAKVLTKAGSAPVTEEMLRKDIAAGAPQNPDGTLNLVHYAAWLVQEAARGD